MTLSFSTHINNQPTFFVEKIWMYIESFVSDEDISHYFQLPQMREHYDFDTQYKMKQTGTPAKIHTIRRDKADRWKPGMKIHFVIHNRTPNRFQFAPELEATAVQDIDIIWGTSDGDWRNGTVGVLIDKREIGSVNYINGNRRCKNFQALNNLALNDGFDNINMFFKYFCNDFSGKIIHWTDLRY